MFHLRVHQRMYLLYAQADLVPIGCTALPHAATNKGHRALAIACIALSAALQTQTLLSISVP